MLTIREHDFAKIGRLFLTSLNEKLVCVAFSKAAVEDFANYLKLEVCYDNSSSQIAINQLEEYLSGQRQDFNLKTEFLTGTDFQKKIWHELARIPYGKTISYQELAQKVGNEKAFRAVGSANGKNPLPIIFPCHRVIKSDGGLGGYSGGLEYKKILLRLEN